jgi:hypothetical protein
MKGVGEAVSACIVARRWADLSPTMKACGRAFGGIDPGRLFHGVMLYTFVQHALTLNEPKQFDECIAAVQTKIDIAASGQSLDAAVEEHRLAFQRHAALAAFHALGNGDSPTEVH